MYKNLNCDLLGINGRQSEIIELAMTYGFRGIAIDILDLVNRTQRTSFENASRFLVSSKLEMGGFTAPIDLDADDEAFAEAVAKLNGVSEIAGRAGAKLALVTLPRDTDRLPYPEYFEVISGRLNQMADIFAKDEVRVAVAMQALEEDSEPKQFKFVQDVESFLGLVKVCPKVGIVFDSWTWYCGKGTVEQFDEIGVERMYAANISDCVEGVSADTAAHGDCLLPGSSSVIDNATYLKKLAEAGTEIPVSARGRALDSNGKRDAFIAKVQDSLVSVLSDAGVTAENRKPEMFINERSFASNAD